MIENAKISNCNLNMNNEEEIEIKYLIYYLFYYFKDSSFTHIIWNFRFIPQNLVIKYFFFYFLSKAELFFQYLRLLVTHKKS